MGGKEAVSFFAGFFVGALIGGATALLMAPQSGEETRTQIREKSIELKDKAEEAYQDALKRLETTTEDIRKRTEEITVKVDQVIAQGKQELTRLGRKAPQMPAEAEPETAA
jgi:gas vesicle protein